MADTLPAAIAVALVLALFPASGAAQSPDAAARAAELEQLRERIAALRRGLDRDLGRHDAARSALRDSEQTVARQAATLRDIDARRRAGARRLDALRTQRADRAAELDGERAALAGQLRAAYALGRQERLKLLLNQEDPAAVGRVLAYHDLMNRSRVARIARVADLLAGLAEVETAIAAETASLDAEAARERETLAALERTRAQRAEVIAELERQVREQGRRLERMQADEQALVRLLESLASVLSDIPADLGGRQALPALRGRLGWPADGRVTGRFGQQADDGMRLRGLLITAPAGADVRAIAYGRVAWAGWMPHYGNLVVLEHGDDFFSLYGHNRALLREVGEWVGAGDVIAQVGDSGGQPRSALYFELRRGRTPVDPQQWLVTR